MKPTSRSILIENVIHLQNSLPQDLVTALKGDWTMQVHDCRWILVTMATALPPEPAASEQQLQE